MHFINKYFLCTLYVACNEVGVGNKKSFTEVTWGTEGSHE